MTEAPVTQSQKNIVTPAAALTHKINHIASEKTQLQTVANLVYSHHSV